MAKNSITSFSVERVEGRTGLLGTKIVAEEVVRMKTGGGSIYLSESAVEGAGDDWERLKRRLKNLSREKGIPFSDVE